MRKAGSRALCIVAALLLSAAAAPALAQLEGRVYATGPVTGDSDEYAILVMHQFAECTVRRRRWAIVRFLEAEPGSRAARRHMMRAIGPDCLRGAEMLSLTGPLARGMLFEAVYRRDHADPPPAGLESAPAIPYPEVRSNAAGHRYSQTALFRLGECVARAAPAEAHALLHTEPVGEAEAATFQLLLPRFAACLPAGAQTEFSAPVLRGAVAEAMYRLRQSPESE